jgi:hypothetical protein
MGKENFVKVELNKNGALFIGEQKIIGAENLSIQINEGNAIIVTVTFLASEFICDYSGRNLYQGTNSE